MTNRQQSEGGLRRYTCSGCGTTIRVAERESQAVYEVLTEVGWAVSPGFNRVLCPACTDEATSETAAEHQEAEDLRILDSFLDVTGRLIYEGRIPAAYASLMQTLYAACAMPIKYGLRACDLTGDAQAAATGGDREWHWS
jgi:hypothetical protein